MVLHCSVQACHRFVYLFICLFTYLFVWGVLFSFRFLGPANNIQFFATTPRGFEVCLMSKYTELGVARICFRNHIFTTHRSFHLLKNINFSLFRDKQSIRMYDDVVFFPDHPQKGEFEGAPSGPHPQIAQRHPSPSFAFLPEPGAAIARCPALGEWRSH